MPRARAAVAVFAVVGAAIALAGCGAQPRPAGSSTPTQEPAQSATSAVPEQLRFTAKTVDGKDFSGESLAGQAAVLWFWAPWCPKCQAEAPSIAAAAETTAGTVAFVGVAAQDDVAPMREFVERNHLGAFPHIADTDAEVWRRFGVTYQPAYAFIGGDGTIEVETSQLSKDELVRRVQALAG